MENEVKINFLSDEPTKEDAFGSHNRVAKALADVILKEKGGKLIAIEGSRGSGKSTVVEILKENLNERAQVFVFDAWSHEGDPLRRTFFEELVDGLDKKLINKSHWQKEIDKLSKRKWEEDTTKYARPTFMGLMYALSLVLAPLGLVLISTSKFVDLAMGLVLFPPLLIVVATLLFFISKFPLSDESRNSLHSFISPFSSKTATHYKSKTTQTVDPTSVEFQQSYVDLMNDALKNNSNKLLLIIDNLDRVDNKTALSVWATMRTFLEVPKEKRLQWQERLWLLVPFATEGIADLWSSNYLLPYQLNTREVESFIDKTFQIRFKVALPVLADWTNYFIDQFHNAFDGYKDRAEAKAVYDVFRHLVFPQLLSPTPRDVKLFINRLCSIYIQRRNEIPLRQQALFVALTVKNQGELPIGYLLDSSRNEIRPLSTDFVGIDYKTSLIAIHYNVSKDKALHIALRPELENALLETNIEKLNNWQALFGFSNIVAEFVATDTTNWSEYNQHYIGYVAHSLSKLKGNKDLNWYSLWENLRNRLIQSNVISILDLRCAQGLSTIIKKFPKDKKLAGKVVELISAGDEIFKSGQKFKEEEPLKETIESMCILVSTIKRLGFRRLLRENFRLSMSASSYNEVMALWPHKGKYSSLAIYAKPSAETDEILSDLSNVVSNGQFSESNYRQIRIFCRQRIGWKWQNFVTTIKHRLKGDNSVETDELSFLLLSLLTIRKQFSDTSTDLSVLATEGHLLSHLGRLYDRLENETISNILYVMLIYNPEGDIHSHIGESVKGFQYYESSTTNLDETEIFVPDIASKIVSNGEFDKILSLGNADNRVTNIARAVLRNIAKRDIITKMITLDGLIQHEVALYNAMGNEYDELIGTFVKETELIQRLVSSDFENGFASLYLAAAKNIKDKNHGFYKFLLKNLRNVTEDDWINHATEEHENLYDLAIYLSDRGLDCELSYSFKRALMKFAEKYFKGGSTSNKILQHWPAVLNVLEESLKLTFLKEYRDSIISEEDDVSFGRLIDKFPVSLVGCPIFVEKAEDLVLKRFYRILDNRNLNYLRWLAELTQQCPEVIQKCTASTLSDFRQRVKYDLENADLTEEEKALLSEISEKL